MSNKTKTLNDMYYFLKTCPLEDSFSLQSYYFGGVLIFQGKIFAKTGSFVQFGQL